MTRNTRILLVFLFVLLTSIISCKSGITLRIEGVVTDATNNSPINGARIHLIKAERGLLGPGPDYTLTGTSTDIQGRYSIEYSLSSRCGKDVTLLATQMGYYDSDYLMKSGQSVRCTRKTQTISFQLEPRDFIRD